MRVGNITCDKGDVKQGYIRTAYTADGAEVKVPLMVACGKLEGPILWINAAVHGEEISGIFAIHKLFASLDTEYLKGTLIASPGCNPLGVRGCNKFTPEDQLDMDQQFPGRADGWLSEQMAYYFFREVKNNIDYLIDLHAMGGMNAVPYTIYKSVPRVDSRVNEISRALALNMGIEFNCYVDLSTATGELPGSVMGALDMQCVLNGIPAIMVEMGAGNRVLWENVDLVVEGLVNNLRYLGMISGEMMKFNGQKIITKRNFPCSHRGGLSMAKAKPGRKLAKGESIVTIIDFVGNELESMTAPQEVYLLGVSENPIVPSGKIVSILGLEWEDIN